jgi:hypothetical protein
MARNVYAFLVFSAALTLAACDAKDKPEEENPQTGAANSVQASAVASMTIDVCALLTIDAIEATLGTRPSGAEMKEISAISMQCLWASPDAPQALVGILVGPATSARTWKAFQAEYANGGGDVADLGEYVDLGLFASYSGYGMLQVRTENDLFLTFTVRGADKDKTVAIARIAVGRL